MTPTPTAPDNQLPDEQAALIGRISSKWALVELKMSFLLGTILEIEPNVSSAILFTVNSNKVRRDIIQNVATNALTDDTFQNQIKSLLRRIGKAAKKRNDLLHALWLHIPEFGTFQFTSTALQPLSGKPVTLDQLKRLYDQIEALTNDLTLLSVRLSHAKKSSS